jgi:DNA-binding NarL/FixJ family response regulator
MSDPIRVAVCDDARAVKLFLRHVLEEEGDIAVVSSTSTGEDALVEISAQRPDVLLLDLVLPDVPEPADLVARLRAASLDTAILLISNLPAFRLQAEAERLGADGWTTKAHKPAELREAVRGVRGGG